MNRLHHTPAESPAARNPPLRGIPRCAESRGPADAVRMRTVQDYVDRLCRVLAAYDPIASPIIHISVTQGIVQNKLAAYEAMTEPIEQGLKARNIGWEPVLFTKAYREEGNPEPLWKLESTFFNLVPANKGGAGGAGDADDAGGEGEGAGDAGDAK